MRNGRPKSEGPRLADESFPSAYSLQSTVSPRFFAPELASLAAGQGPWQVELDLGESHHALHVLRLRAGDAVELFDGQGRSAAGKITQSRHGVVSVEGEQPSVLSERPGPVVHLAFAVPKAKRLDWLLEKATELGAASLRPVIFERSVAGGDELGPGKRNRWQGHCVSAAKQCGLDFLPEIHELAGLGEFIGAAAALGALRVAGDASADAASMAQAVAARQPRQAVLLLVGPEGGMTPAEHEALRAGGFAFARLGRTTLRVETAAIALLAASAALSNDQ
jgi:16S rRNA (uracil1498-N3)-methyltransferase